MIKGGDHREPADEFRDQTVLDQVLGDDLLELFSPPISFCD
jgi:hypothetical protein